MANKLRKMNSLQKKAECRDTQEYYKADDFTPKDYNIIIREMIKSETEIRSQRTNWFLVIQGFLIAGVCQFSKITLFHGLIILVGIVTSLSFCYAAWRSTLAVKLALTCWKEYTKGKDYSKYPPVSLITSEILKAEYSDKNELSWEE